MTATNEREARRRRAAARGAGTRVPVGTAPVRVPGSKRPRRRLPIRPVDLLVGLGYLLGALYVQAHLIIDPVNRVQRNNPNDQSFFEFVLAHGARVVTHGANPFFTRQMNVPDGVNLMANTSVLGLSLPLAPVTLLFGVSVSYAVLSVLALAVTATSWYALLVRHVVRSRVAAAVGGGFAAFAPGVVAQANGHPNIVAQFLVPWIAWRALRLGTAPRVVPNAVALALLVIWQFFINEEVLFLTGTAVALILLVHVLWHRWTVRAWARPYLRGAAVAGAVVAVALAYPVWFQFFGPQHYRGLPPLIQVFGIDLWAYVSYASESLAGNINTAYLFAANPAEQNAFFGWGLPVVIGLILWRLRRDCLVIGLAVAALTFVLLSLGGRVVVRGHHFGLPGPWAAVSRLPLFDTVVAPRLALAVVPLTAVLLALGCDAFLAWSGRLRRAQPAAVQSRAQPAAVQSRAQPRPAPFRFAGVALLAVALAPIAPSPLPVSGKTPVPAFISDGIFRDYVPAGRSLVTVPLPRPPLNDELFFAASVNLAFAFPRGYFLGPDRDPAHRLAAMYGAPARPTSTLLEDVAFTGLLPPIGPAQRADAVRDLTFWHAAALILPFGSDQEFPLYQATSALVGARPRPVGGVWLWDVRPLLGVP